MQQRSDAHGKSATISWNQRRLWYLDQLSPGNPAYNTPYALRFEGSLDLAAFKRALDAVVGRQEILRTVFLPRNGSPFPVLLPKWSVELKQIDLREYPLENRESEGERITRHEAMRPFDLARDVKLRVLLVRLSDERWMLLHNSHHIAFEGGSVGVLHRDLKSFYTAFLGGQEPRLPEMTRHYSDFAAWQMMQLQEPRLEELVSFWKMNLSGVHPLNLPIDFPRPAIHRMAGCRYPIGLSSALIHSCNDFFSTNKTSSYRGLCAAFNVFLYCYSEMTDIAMGSPVSPPSHLGLDDVIGFFVNTVVVRTRFAPNNTFREVMKQVHDQVHQVIKHSDLPFDKIVEAARPSREAGRTPLFQVNFRAPKMPYPTLELPGITAGPTRYIDNGTSKFDLALEIETSRADACYMEYRTDLFKLETIQQMAVDFERLLRAFIAQPEVPIKDLDEVKGIRKRVGESHAGLRMISSHKPSGAS